MVNPNFSQLNLTLGQVPYGISNPPLRIVNPSRIPTTIRPGGTVTANNWASQVVEARNRTTSTYSFSSTDVLRYQQLGGIVTENLL